MVLRTFRLAEPYQMHFDEVYHARTATEFLQYWRYGLSHDIYEWTHPHLAKYAMAGGHRRCGARTTSAPRATSACRSARSPSSRGGSTSTLPGGRAGERLHVATGTEIRSYDLRTRELDLDRPGAGRQRAGRSTTTGNQLVVGYDDGRIATLDLDLDRATAASTLGAEPSRVATVDHPVDHLFVTDDGASVVAASADRLTTVDLVDGSTIAARSTCPGSPTSRPAAAARALVATVDEVTDPRPSPRRSPTSCRARRRRLPGDGSTDASPGTTVVLGDPGSGETRDEARRRDRRRDAARHQRRERDADRGRDRRRRRVHRPGAGRRSSRRSRWTAAPTAWRS